MAPADTVMVCSLVCLCLMDCEFVFIELFYCFLYSPSVKLLVKGHPPEFPFRPPSCCIVDLVPALVLWILYFSDFETLHLVSALGRFNFSAVSRVLFLDPNLPTCNQTCFIII